MNSSPLRTALIAPLLLAGLARQAEAAAPADLFAQRCESEMVPIISVEARPPGFQVHNTVSARVLNTRGADTSAGQALLGMTASSTRADIDIGGPSLFDPASGRECVAPHIAVEISYQPLDVYVAREFHPASCSYREVYAHEMQHVRVYLDNLPHIERHVRAELVSRYGGRPLYAPHNQGVNLLNADIDSWLRPFIRAELAQVEAQQRALDSRDENERLSHLCQGEIASALGSSF